MTTYAWTLGTPSAFELRVIPNAITFTSPYNKSTQTVDFLGERWQARIDLPADSNPIVGAAREAFFDRLRGPVNLVSLWNLRRPMPQGTITGSPTVSGAIAQLANTLNIQGLANQTLRAGDHIGVGGQLLRVMADITADGAGLYTAVEVLPRFRAAVASASAVTLSKPTANFMLKSDGVPIVWRPGLFEGVSLEMIEAF